MHDITKLNLTVEQITGNKDGSTLFLSNKAVPIYNGSEKTDQIAYVKYGVVLPDNDYEKINVKVKQLKPLFSDEQMQAQKGKVKVRFKNLTGRFYRTDRGEYALTCSADDVEVIS